MTFVYSMLLYRRTIVTIGIRVQAKFAYCTSVHEVHADE
jgi:hypothetical protein